MVLVATLGPALHADAARAGCSSPRPLLLLFGMRWLRKAVPARRRVIALHDEADGFVGRRRRCGPRRAPAKAGTSWRSRPPARPSMLEGVEVVFTVVAIGAVGAMCSCPRASARLGSGGRGHAGARVAPAARAHSGECAEIRGGGHALGVRRILARRRLRFRLAGTGSVDPRADRGVRRDCDGMRAARATPGATGGLAGVQRSRP